MKTSQLSIQIRDVNVEIRTNHCAYYNYLCTCLNKILQHDNAVRPTVQIDIDWTKKPRFVFGDGANMRVIGANTLLGAGKVATERKISRKVRVRFNYALDGHTLRLQASVRRKPLKDFLQYDLLAKPREQLFFELTYPLVYYPALWHLEYNSNTHPMHASAVRFDGRYVLISGLEGIGKTTLSLALAKSPGNELFSDNLVLHDEKYLYPCYEPVRIHKTDDKSLWEGRFKKLETLRSLKDFYEPISFDPHLKGKVDVVIIPSFAKEFFCKKISREECASKIINGSSLAGEIGNYNEYAYLLNLMVPEFNLHKTRLEALTALIGTAPCYEVSMRKADGVKANVERVKKLISG